MLAGALGSLVHLGSTTARLAAVDVNNVYGIAHATVSRRRIESGLVCQVRPVALETMWRKARERVAPTRVRQVEASAAAL